MLVLQFENNGDVGGCAKKDFYFTDGYVQVVAWVVLVAEGVDTVF